MAKNGAKAIQYGWRNRFVLREMDHIYANDQLCGLVALGAWLLWKIPYTYDAHEMMPFRARRSGICRMAFEALLERHIVGCAGKCYVVNRPIKYFYRRMYKNHRIAVRMNDFYRTTALSLCSDGRRMLLYIGASNEHRGLALMNQVAIKSLAKQVMVIPGQHDIYTGDVTKIGLRDYPEKLVGILNGSMPYMWCCFSVNFLSYRYSLPNKFFQALAFGVPIIAAKGTYMEKLIRKYNIGVVFDNEIDSEMWSPETYNELLFNVHYLRQEIKANRIYL